MIEFRNVYKVYEPGTKALNGVSLKIEDGEFVFVPGIRKAVEEGQEEIPAKVVRKDGSVEFVHTLNGSGLAVGRTLAAICENAEIHYNYDRKFDTKWESNITETIAKSVVTASKEIGAKVIVAATMSGKTAIKISNLKPITPILATVPSSKVARGLALNWGVYPSLVKEYNTTDEIVSDGIEKAKEFIKLNKGDNIIITGGFPNIGVKVTNFMKIEEI